MLNKKFSLLAGSAALMLGNVCAIAHAAENNVTISSDQGMQAVQTKVQPRNYTINIATPAAQNAATAPAQLNSAQPAATQVNSAPPAAAQAKSAPVKSATVKSAPVAGQVKPYIPDDAPVAKAPASAAPAAAPATLAPAPAAAPATLAPAPAPAAAPLISAPAQTMAAPAPAANAPAVAPAAPNANAPAASAAAATAAAANATIGNAAPQGSINAPAANAQAPVPVATRGGPTVTEELQTQSKTEISNRAQVNDQLYPATNNPNGQGAFTPAEPGFTFETQAQEQKAADGGTGNPNDQIQEVSVTMLTDFDAAVVEGFKSLESSLTLGMGRSTNLTIDDVAPALRSFTTDADGNLVLRFSVPMAQSIIKKKGTPSWNGLSNPILVWMAGLDGSSGGTNMSLVSGQNLSPFASAILGAAPEYKYRMIFPVLDIEEIQKVSVNTVLDHRDDVLAAASARYGADYFIAAAISSVPNESGMTFKWNLFYKDGTLIAQSAISGLMDEVAALGAGDIARALMTYQSNQTESNEPSALSKNNVDIDMIGPGDGYVRMRISNVRSLQDIKEIRNIFITYGFDGDTRVIGFDNGLLVFEVATNSEPDNLAATMRRSGEFKYLAPWTFDFVKNVSVRPSNDTFVGTSTDVRPNSRINPDLVRPAHPSNMRKDSEVGVGEGLPSRSTPAIQGTDM
ncbi:DUF2066 domain-containing protein [uncultured Anaerobiospirillum sp.]|uniref:DUF2066 domain-containing protein n=1 Tax=uncultured Anaerobiospirillum sp. TaxID=265728 RepID=UPI002804564A|nr:DUF2066 domain-containing protein [uncultured Anaerobiospirillum sp.]